MKRNKEKTKVEIKEKEENAKNVRKKFNPLKFSVSKY